MVSLLAALAFALLVIVGSRHSAEGASPVAVVHRPSVMSQLRWTPALASRFAGCAAKVPDVASAFVVERLDGSIQRMSFDNAWRRTHDQERADDVWTLGECK